MLTHWAGLEFRYPADFQPTTNVGSPIPNPLRHGTYLVGEQRLDNLAAGADQIVKFTWPQALVPPETVVVSGANVRWHPCLLVEASPHDGPAPIGGLSVPVQGNNNIAQRNIEIDNVGDAGSDLFVGMIAGTRDDVGIATLILDATRLRGNAAIRLHVASNNAMKQLIEGALRETKEQGATAGPNGKGECPSVIVEERTRLRVECGECAVIIEAAPGSRILSGGGHAKPFEAAWVKHQDLEAVEIRGLRGRLELPLRLGGGEFVPLLVAVDGDATGDLGITQRRGDGELSAGYGIRRVAGTSTDS
jgi:hypothetical protein